MAVARSAERHRDKSMCVSGKIISHRDIPEIVSARRVRFEPKNEGLLQRRPTPNRDWLLKT
jgi:hypothetical protein